MEGRHPSRWSVTPQPGAWLSTDDQEVLVATSGLPDARRGREFSPVDLCLLLGYSWELTCSRLNLWEFCVLSVGKIMVNM